MSTFRSGKGETKCTSGKKKIDSLAFKANMKAPLCYFSNLFGGAEFTFMMQRTQNPCLINLYQKLRDKDWESQGGYDFFLHYRSRLMFPKHTGACKYSISDNSPYYKSNIVDGPKIAAGLLAKLISGCFRPTMKFRLRVVNQMARDLWFRKMKFQEIVRSDFSQSNEKVNDKWEINDDSPSVKKTWMKRALRLKYQQAFYRNLLLNPKYSGIYEQKGGRDRGSIWVGKKGLLAEFLKEVKEEILFETQNAKVLTFVINK
jgi:hypothetical protein